MFTFIIVSYNTEGLLRRAVDSIRVFYPNAPVCVIDGSDTNNKCFQFVYGFSKLHPLSKNMRCNIGHGQGMDYAMSLIKTPFAVLMDSDACISKPLVVEMMLGHAAPDVYGIGKIVQVDSNGINVDKGIPYLHPYFAVINREQYFKHEPFVHHGAPCIRTMISLVGKKVRILDFPVENYVTHEWRGTRKLNPKEFHSRTWDKNQSVK